MKRASLVAHMVKNLPAMQETRFNPWVGKIPGEGKGYPLQFYCLENSMDRGVWQVTAHKVAKSWTRLATNTTTINEESVVQRGESPCSRSYSPQGAEAGCPPKQSGARTHVLNSLCELAFEVEGSQRVWQGDMQWHSAVMTLSTPDKENKNILQLEFFSIYCFCWLNKLLWTYNYRFHVATEGLAGETNKKTILGLFFLWHKLWFGRERIWR